MNSPRLLLSLFLAYVALTAAAQTTPTPASAPASASAKPTYTRTEDVVYGRKFGVALTLDVFQPAQPNGYGVIALVSGGWKSSREGVSPGSYAQYLARGYTVFAVVHGSQPKFTIAEIVPDINRAVRFIRYNAARWKIDPSHLGITGSSAGGHLSLTLGTQGGPGQADAKDPVERESSAVQAVACFYPPTDFLNYGAEGEIATGVGTLKDYVPAFGPDAATEEGRRRLGEKLSPARYITPAMAPTLIIHGDADKLVPIQQSQLFVKRAETLGANAKLIVKPGAEHGGKTWLNMEGDRVLFANWFDQYLRGQKPAQ
jgi:acetyl esterase/lipase